MYEYTMLEKMLFMYHGGLQQPATISTASPTTGLVILGVLAILAIGIWMYFARRKSI